MMERHNEDGRILLSEGEPMPGYAELISRGYAVMLAALKGCTDCGWELSRSTLMTNAHITWVELALFLLCTVFWTAMRGGMTAYVFQPLARWSRLQPKDAAKMPESAWKLTFYTLAWSYSAYLLFFAGYSFFQDPGSAFHGWQSGMRVPCDIAIAYLIQGSFYGHSIYATLYMDAWRRDSIVMLAHHLITLALIAFSYAFRYHNVGVLVLFLHDISDVQLELTKLNVYFKSRGGGRHLINEVVSNLGCVSFSFSWFWFRLYWFPLKVLYATCITSLEAVPNIPLYFFFNFLLFLLLLMNIYWFLFILLFVAKVLTGRMKELSDVREYEEEGEPRKVPFVSGPDANGKYMQNGVVKDKNL
ncbi:ceramide synthase 1-like isoform X2 [Brienomyrus brachyistius]|uniref:ceramide synthase 1-like isoform X2 n=1 Tax=Brienomyrus brachyistius TaxID=42636 RepID=UPI0020B27C1D|nr:ceramide synthase 1-like isoform X2 [Brienomyrus brachyistius]